MSGRALLIAVLLSGCASVPKIPDAPMPLPAGGQGYPLCKVITERTDHWVLSGLDDFSFATWNSVMSTVVMKRPDGLLLIDPTFAKSVRADLTHVGAFAHLVTGDAETKTPVVTAMSTAGLDPMQVKWALITHSHWDHTGALGDLKSAEIKMSRAEYDFQNGFKGEWDHGAIVVTLERARSRFTSFDFDGPPLLGFDASKDLFGDGSVIAVPLPGHTPGHTGYLLRDDGGQWWLMIGDASWLLRGVEEPARKNFIARGLDENGDATGITLARLHALLKAHPEIHQVPAHDARGYEGMPECGK